MKSRFLLTIAIALGLLILCEVGARTALPDVPNCFRAARNPFRYRAWPEYMRGLKTEGNKGTVVLLSNCQAYGGEYPASKGYPARLERLLRDRSVGGRSDWEVLNWSVDGTTSMELVLLASYLQEHPPEIVLAVTGYGDYRSEHFHEGFSYCRSDVPRLLARRDVLKRLPARFLRRHSRVEDTLSFYAADRFALLRYREYMWSWLESRFPGIHESFYAPGFNYMPWRLPKRYLVEPLEFDTGATDMLTLELTYDDDSSIMFREYIEELVEIPSRVVLVSEPGLLEPNDDLRRFLDDIESAAREHNLPLWELHNTLPANAFLTSTHFHRRNHQRFAELLAERVADVLDGN